MKFPSQKHFSALRCSFTAFALLLVLPIAGLRAQDFTYTNNNGAITITGYTGPGGNVAIPSTIDGQPVTSIEDSAFYNSLILSSVAIPNGVTNIGSYAFFNATGLTNVSISEGLRVIGDDTFAGCTHLNGVAIPNSVTSLGQEAFFNCSALASLTIGTGIASIHGGSESGFWGTFAYCTSLTKLTIPDNVTSIGDGPVSKAGATGAFFNCSGLTNVIIGKGLFYLGLGAFSYCTNLVGIYFRGNAPLHSQDMFGEDTFHFTPATLYYLPGTTGWGGMYSTLPTALWNPHALVNDGNFGIRQNRFGFNVTGTPAIPLVVEATTNLAAQSWVPLLTGTLTNGLIYLSDGQWTNYPERIYRIRSP